MEKVITIQPYANGVQAYCKWNNRRLCVFYCHETNEFITEIKSYFKGENMEDTSHSFFASTAKRGVYTLSYKLTFETFCILNKCQNTIVEYMRGNIKGKKDNKDK